MEKTKFNFNPHVGKRIVELRKKHNLSQKELAEKIDMSASALSRVENDHEMLWVSKMILMCDLFGLTPNEFLGIE